MPPAGFHDYCRAFDIHVDIWIRIRQAEHVIHLSSQVKNEILTSHQVVHYIDIPDVAEVNGYTLTDWLDVEQVTSVPRDHRIDDGHLRTQLGHGDSQVAPDETRSPRYQ